MGETTAVRGHMVHEAEYEAQGETTVAGEFAYRGGDWKLIFDGDQVPIGLYDLANDPIEATNLLSQPGQNNRAAAMQAGLENALASARTAPPIGTALVTVPDVTDLSQASGRKCYPII